MTSDERKKFRASKTWKDFRKQIIAERGLGCECCGRKTKSVTLHHKNMDKTQYTNLTDKAHFSLLCQSCHTFVHYCYTQIHKKNATPTQHLINFQSPYFL
jgi:hypothetical protein